MIFLRVLYILGMIFAGHVCCSADTKPLAILNAWVRVLEKPQNVAAIYLDMKNDNDQPWEVVYVKSSYAQKANIEQSYVDEEGVSRTVVLDKLLIPAHSQVNLKPAGIHITLHNITENIKQSDAVPLDIYFADGTVLHITAKVKK